MKIISAKFIKTVVGEDRILEDGVPQIAFIGRSNVGKSSTINALVKQKGLAIVSALPGRTQGVNVFLINEKFYLVDLPGYGFAKLSKTDRAWLHELINWYLFNQKFVQKKIVLIIDANVGPTKDDLELLRELEAQNKNILVIANKIDKIKKIDYFRKCQKIKDLIGYHEIIFYSSKTGTGVPEIIDQIIVE
ncbi:MAG: ribosome biogenesis GTP-binding protein YihA/YsxC [Candidatus Falkowbacteria bacterium]